MEVVFFGRVKQIYPPRTDDSLKMDEVFQLDEIVGVQVLSELIKTHANNLINSDFRTTEHIYDSYEMNLVLKDSTRVNVVDHANLSTIKKEAIAIANRLNVPVWLASNLK